MPPKATTISTAKPTKITATITTNEYQGSVSGNKDIMLSNSNKKQTKAKKVTEIQPVMSKSLMKKMSKVIRDKESKKHRLHSLQILQEHQFDGDKRVLFQQSGTIGTERTKAEQLARLFALKQSGVVLSVDDQSLLQEALVDYGDIDNSIAYADKKRKEMTSYAHKTITSNPFMPLSSASATISATIQDRLLHKKIAKNGQKKLYSDKELAAIAEDMHVTEFDVSHIKKIKKRQRNEQNKLIRQKLQVLNSKNLQDMTEDDIQQQQKQMIILPKELHGLSTILNEQSGGKIEIITSNVSGAQLHKPRQGLNTGSAAEPIDDSLRAAAQLIMRGLLTTKSKNKVDSLFDVAAFSSDDDDDDGDGDDDSDDNNGLIGPALPKQQNKPSAEEELWGANATSGKDTKNNNNNNTNKKKLNRTNNTSMDDEFVSAATANKKTQDKLNPNNNNNNNTAQSVTSDLSASLPMSLAMPTITRTNRAAAANRTIPIAVLGDGSNTTQPIIIKRNKPNDSTTKTTTTTTTTEKSTGQFDDQQYVQLQQKESEYAVKFQVLKSRDVRNFLQSIHEGTNADMSDAEDEAGNNNYNNNNNNSNDMASIYGNSSSSSTNQNGNQEVSQGKKRKILFDFTQPLTVPTITRSTIEVIQPPQPVVTANTTAATKSTTSTTTTKSTSSADKKQPIGKKKGVSNEKTATKATKATMTDDQLDDFDASGLDQFSDDDNQSTPPPTTTNQTAKAKTKKITLPPGPKAPNSNSVPSKKNEKVKSVSPSAPQVETESVQIKPTPQQQQQPSSGENKGKNIATKKEPPQAVKKAPVNPNAVSKKKK